MVGRVRFVCFLSIVAAGIVVLIATSLGLLFLGEELFHHPVLNFTFRSNSGVSSSTTTGLPVSEALSSTHVFSEAVSNDSDSLDLNETSSDCLTGVIISTLSEITSSSVIDVSSTTTESVSSSITSPTSSSGTMINSLLPTEDRLLRRSSLTESMPIVRTDPPLITTTPLPFHKRPFEIAREQGIRDFDSYYYRTRSPTSTRSHYPNRVYSITPSPSTHKTVTSRIYFSSTTTPVMPESMPVSMIPVLRANRPEHSVTTSKSTLPVVSQRVSSARSQRLPEATTRRAAPAAAARLMSPTVSQPSELTSFSSSSTLSSTRVFIPEVPLVTTLKPASSSSSSPALFSSVVSTVTPITPSTSAAPPSGSVSKHFASDVTITSDSSESMLSESASSIMEVVVSNTEALAGPATTTEITTSMAGVLNITENVMLSSTTTEILRRILPIPTRRFKCRRVQYNRLCVSVLDKQCVLIERSTPLRTELLVREYQTADPLFDAVDHKEVMNSCVLFEKFVA